VEQHKVSSLYIYIHNLHFIGHFIWTYISRFPMGFLRHTCSGRKPLDIREWHRCL